MQCEARADYLLGFDAAIQIRLTAARNVLEAEASTTTALILYDREAIERYTAEKFNVQRNDSEMPNLKDPGAARAGFSAGSRVDLDQRPTFGTGSDL